MDIQEILGLLRNEIVAETPRLTEFAATVADAESDEHLMLAAEQYADSAGRIATAAVNLGLVGVEASARALVEGTMLAPVLEPPQRRAFGAVLRQWPPAVCSYLANSAAAADAQAIADLLAPFPDLLGLVGHDAATLALSLQQLPDFAALIGASSSAARPSIAGRDDVSLVVPADVDAQLYDSFIVDAPDQAAQLSVLVDKLAHGSAVAEDVLVAKRIAHTFKGSANIIGIRGLANLAHHTEDILEFVAANPAGTPPALTKTLVDAAGCMEAMVYSLLGAEPQPVNSLAVLQQVLDWAGAIDAGEVGVGEAGSPSFTPPALTAVAAADAAIAEPTPANPAPDTATALIRVPLRSVEELLRLTGENAALLAALRTLEVDVRGRAAALDAQLKTVADRLAELEVVVDVRGPGTLARGSARAGGTFDALEMDHYNELHSTTRALMESAADARAVARDVNTGLAQLDALLGEGEQVQADLHFHTIGMRLAPLSNLSPRLQRTVRQAAGATGKTVNLIIDGDDIEVDGEIVNQLADPLLHILRNATDHGIETAERRRAAGKSEAGTIELRFERAGQQVVITCRDDGAGLDLDRIRTKAEALGLVGAGMELNQDDLARLILLPGFTTREAVTELSGRGIGLDVVRERVERLGGSLAISSRRGEGTTLTIRLQASLATVFAMLVEVEQQTFAIPCHAIASGLAAGQTEVSRADGGDGVVYQVGGIVHPGRSARALLGYDNDFAELEQWRRRPALVLQAERGAVVVAVDRIVEVQELFLRGTGELLQEVPGFSGAALIGDGRVVPVIDLPALLRAPMPVMPASVDGDTLLRRSRGRILAVDDSLSVRQMLAELLGDAGFEVQTAVDGLHALRRMEEFNPDLVVTDLEMPNLNGLELTARLRREPATAALPVIMITSRSQDKHRAQALSAGVSVYLTKPYTDDNLLDEVAAVLRRQQAGEALEAV